MPALPETLAQHSIGRFNFEDGTIVHDAAFSYALTVPPGPVDGLVIICPSLTGTPVIQQAWWQDVGVPLAHERYATLYPHAFSDGTLAHFPRDRPPGIRDIARGIVALGRALGLPAATFVTGGSMGGMLSLEVCIESGAPTHALVLAAPAVQTAWGAGWNLVQLQALALGGATHGLALARAVGMMTYRTEREFESRFGMDTLPGDGRTMSGYLQHHGDRLIARFDAAEYERRVRAMDTHDVGRNRGGWRNAIAPHADRITAVGVTGDALYSADIVEAWANASGAEFVNVSSIHGHDAFILEREQIRAVIATVFARATLVTTTH
ncbi:MAG: alpha/beta fold hydrolase [Gemmatimonadaceae bacterium]|nr:alpha/beta fold hydrolase [Gemmatimonadaceae bacterium]